MKIYLYLILFISLWNLNECVQPYFPSQVVFYTDYDATLFAIDEVNQRASQVNIEISEANQTSFVMKNFSYSVPDTPESTYYVQLILNADFGCIYQTYWTYGGNVFNLFPSHWLTNSTSIEIKNYIEFQYEMIKSKNASADEDYWYSNHTCKMYTGHIYPCEEIYFKKNTDIPLRFVHVIKQGSQFVQETTSFHVVSTGKPDETYFNSLPKDWYTMCLDLNLRLLIDPATVKINLNESAPIQISLPTPPHRIDGNDSVIIEWNMVECNDCLIWSPEKLIFNSENFHNPQILTVTRVRADIHAILVPIFTGGGFHPIFATQYEIIIL